MSCLSSLAELLRVKCLLREMWIPSVGDPKFLQNENLKIWEYTPLCVHSIASSYEYGAFGATLFGFASQLCHLPALGYGTSDAKSLYLSCLIFKVVVRIQWLNM